MFNGSLQYSELFCNLDISQYPITSKTSEFIKSIYVGKKVNEERMINLMLHKGVCKGVKYREDMHESAHSYQGFEDIIVPPDKIK